MNSPPAPRLSTRPPQRSARLPCPAALLSARWGWGEQWLTLFLIPGSANFSFLWSQPGSLFYLPQPSLCMYFWHLPHSPVRLPRKPEHSWDFAEQIESIGTSLRTLPSQQNDPKGKSFPEIVGPVLYTHTHIYIYVPQAENFIKILSIPHTHHRHPVLPPLLLLVSFFSFQRHLPFTKLLCFFPLPSSFSY